MLIGRDLWNPTSCSKQDCPQHQTRSGRAFSGHASKTSSDGDPAASQFPLSSFCIHSYFNCGHRDLQPSTLVSKCAVWHKHEEDTAMCLSGAVFCKSMGLCFPFHSISVFPPYFVDDCCSICTQPSSLMSLYQPSLLQQKRSLMQIDVLTLTNKASARQHRTLFIYLLLQFPSTSGHTVSKVAD